MDGTTADNRLIEVTGGPPPITIADVLSVMQKIDGLLPTGDGLRWFNLLYMMVTQKVDSSPPQGGWEDSAWLTRLDVVFARFYFSAILNWLNCSVRLANNMGVRPARWPLPGRCGTLL